MFDAISSSGGGYTPQAVSAAASTATHTAGFTGPPSEPAAHTANPILFSPNTIKVDPVSHLAIFEKRDPETGDVIQQYPSSTVVDEYRKISQGQATPANIGAANALGADISATEVAALSGANTPAQTQTPGAATPQTATASPENTPPVTPTYTGIGNTDAAPAPAAPKTAAAPDTQAPVTAISQSA